MPDPVPSKPLSSLLLHALGFACLFLGGALHAVAQGITVPLTPEHWTLSQKNFKLTQDEDTSHNGEATEFLGRPCLRLSRGLYYAKDIDFQDGAIDVDVASADGKFFGIAFHVQSEENQELIFFRPRTALINQQVQYTPVLLGAPAWQLYGGPEYTSGTKIPRNEWFHVRIEISGHTAKLFLNHSAEAALNVPDLKLGATHGSIGFWGHMGDSFYSNLTYTPMPAAAAATPTHHELPGVLTGWSLSPVFDTKGMDLDAAPNTKAIPWEKVAPEDDGMVVINRYRVSPNVLPPDPEERAKGQRTGGAVVYARTIIHSDRDQIRKLDVGYSDEVVVYLNGKPIYSGNNALSSRQPQYLGLLNPDADAVYLPLKKGDNELVLGVTEYFGGWAFLCKWEQP